MNESPPRRFYGKFRGKVLDNIDPLMLHRLLVDVPAIDGFEASWALPCVPYAGPQVGFVALPPMGANLWVEFEGGDPSHPIWVGCFWVEGERPIMALTPEIKVFKTDSTTLIINDTPELGGLSLLVAPPAVMVPVTVTIDSTGLKAETAESVIMLTPEVISAAIPPTSTSLTAASISALTEGTITATAALVEVTAAVNVTGVVSIEGDVNILGAVSIEGDVNILGGLEVEGDISFVGMLDGAGDVAIAGAIETLDVVTAALEIIPFE
jgi:hypothetical protein